MKTLLSFIAIISCVAMNFTTKAQYEISFQIADTKEDTLLLCYYYLDNTYIWDTAINKKNKFVFKSDRHLEDGIYFITNSKKNRVCEFLVFGDTKLDFKTKDENWLANLTEKKSEKEKIYLDFIIKQNDLGQQFSNLKRNKANLDEKDYKEQSDKLTLKNDSLKNDFITNNPDHLLTKILSCTKPIKDPGFIDVFDSEGKIDSAQMIENRYYWYKNHYFDNIDLSCKGLLRTPKAVFFDNYNNFWSNVLKYAPCDTIIHYIDYYLQKAKPADNIYQYMIYDLTRRYLTDNIMGHDKIYVDMVNKYFKTGIQTTLDPTDVQLNIIRADKWSNILIGKTIPNLACPETDDSSTWHHLNEIKAKYKILVFWSIECGHCATEIPTLAKIYNAHKQEYNIEVFAVHTEGDIEQMHNFVLKNNANWINTNGLYANYDWREYFDIEKTPVIYVLDSNNKILAKNIAASNLEKVLQVLEKGGFNL